LFDGGFLVFNASFNNMPVLLEEETGENHPPVRKSLTNFITSCCTPHPDRDSNSRYQWWYALIA